MSYVVICGGITGVAAEGDAGAGQQLPQALQLIVGQGVHGVDDDGAHATPVPIPSPARGGRELAQAVIDDGDEECFSLAGASARGDDGVAAPLRLPPISGGGMGRETTDGFGLMLPELIEAPVSRGDARVEHAGGDQVVEGTADLERTSQGNKGLLPQELLLSHQLVELLAQCRVADREAGLDVAPVGVFDAVSGNEGLHKVAPQATSSQRIWGFIEFSA